MMEIAAADAHRLAMGLDEVMVRLRPCDQTQRLGPHLEPVLDRAAGIFSTGGCIEKVASDIPSGEIAQIVEVRHLPRRHEIMRQKTAHPGVAGFRKGGEPDDATQITHSRYPCFFMT